MVYSPTGQTNSAIETVPPKRALGAEFYVASVVESIGAEFPDRVHERPYTTEAP